MQLIKNQTVYDSKPFLRFEKFPYYTSGGQNGHVLNKVHLNLGFTKLVSRINKTAPRQECIQLINKYTGGMVRTHTVSENEDGKPDKQSYYFVSRKNDYIGNVNKGWWYYKNNLRVCEEYPSQVAMLIGKSGIEGYYGFSHRGGQLFKIGDRLFDEKYVPVKEDYPEKTWRSFEKEYEERLNYYLMKHDELGYEDLSKSGISSIIRFTLRGKKQIENLEEAKQAALNISNYLS